MDLAPLTAYSLAISTSSSRIRAYAIEQVRVTKLLDQRLMRLEEKLAALRVDDGTLNEALAAVRALRGG
jgi:uncharacterized membrane protein